MTHETFDFKYFKFVAWMRVSTSTTQHSYSIKEAAALTGLPASTLRYYESIGVIAPVGRGASSKHRVYDEGDLDQIMWVACLAATGLSVSDMKEYVANGQLGPSAAGEQVALLTAQQQRLVRRASILLFANATSRSRSTTGRRSRPTMPIEPNC